MTVLARDTATAPVAPDASSSARRQLMAQIARLERGGAASSSKGAAAGPRLLSLGELEAARDGLLATKRLTVGRNVAHERLEAMIADPAAHRWERVALKDLGRPGCGVYRVVPRFGPVGALAGWWRVTLSSGCP